MLHTKQVVLDPATQVVQCAALHGMVAELVGEAVCVNAPVWLELGVPVLLELDVPVCDEEGVPVALELAEPV